jgi:hypothetical protein
MLSLISLLSRSIFHNLSFLIFLEDSIEKCRKSIATDADSIESIDGSCMSIVFIAKTSRPSEGISALFSDIWIDICIDPSAWIDISLYLLFAQFHEHLSRVTHFLGFLFFIEFTIISMMDRV